MAKKHRPFTELEWRTIFKHDPPQLGVGYDRGTFTVLERYREVTREAMFLVESLLPMSETLVIEEFRAAVRPLLQKAVKRAQEHLRG